MPKKHYEIFFVSTLSSINKIKKSTKDVSFGQFVEDHNLFDGTLRRLQVIGDSIKNLLLSDFLQKEDPTWRDIVDFRNLVVHEYFSIDPEIIFRVVSTKIEDLEKNILAIMKQIPDKTYLLYALRDSRKVLKKMKRYDGAAYLEDIERDLI